MANFHTELWVKQQHKVDSAIIPAHIHEERVFHHQPALRPAETELMMAKAVQTLNAVTTWPLVNRPLPKKEKPQMSRMNRRDQVSHLGQPLWLKCFAYKPLGPRSATKERALIERNSICQGTKRQFKHTTHNVPLVLHSNRLRWGTQLPCCGHFYRIQSQEGYSGTPRGISVSEKQNNIVKLVVTF